MENFNGGTGYYPDEMEFDEKTQTLKKINKNKKIVENSQNNEKKEQNFAQNNLLNNFSNIFKGNEMVENLLKGGDLKNNFLMQALNNFGNKKSPKPEKVSALNLDEEDYFEEF